ncbi:MAG: serpin family protein [Thermacetogeniaceae bacterium]|nr:serpin family protein [Thermoanaerobacterales bacterium]HAF18077.1 serine proteinase inhibitor [Peptococcaceae bacterium]
MKQRVFNCLIVFICLSLAFSGCASQGGAADLMADLKPSQQPASPAQIDKAIKKESNAFAVDLFKKSAENEGNIMISPASVYLALAMTLNGADGETKTAMLDVLADPGLTVDLINNACRSWIDLLEKTDSKTKLEIANSIWFDQDFTPYKPFLQKNADYFAADIKKLNFNDRNTPKIINNWVKEATHNTIDKIVDSIDPDVVIYLINAVYFKSDWQTEFNKNNTRDRTFNTPDGTIETPFMHRLDRMTYFSINKATGVALPYADQKFAYFALLPDKEMTPREWLAEQDQSLFNDLARLMAKKPKYTVQLAMPKFEVHYEDSLLNELTELGMGIAFDPDQSDFSQMNEQHTKDLYISEVKHKTFIRVDEKGTEASAATSVEVRVTSAPQFDKELTLDRPFLYGIMDLQTGMPLFVGIMENPAAE